jgi:hypothetical protein
MNQLCHLLVHQYAHVLQRDEGQYSHAEGARTVAGGEYSHAQGYQTQTEGPYSHAGGINTVAGGQVSFVHGSGSTAGHTNSIVLGANITSTVANATYVDRLSIKTYGPYNDDAAADADATMPSGGLYTLKTGNNRAVFRKP